KKENFFRAIIFNDNRGFRLKFYYFALYKNSICYTLFYSQEDKATLESDPSAMRVTVRMERCYSFCVDLSFFNSSV
ncbi:MAG: hypothetical protein ACE5H1_06095, partial [Thermodesulfobacteriota bacterium]